MIEFRHIIAAMLFVLLVFSFGVLLGAASGTFYGLVVR